MTRREWVTENMPDKLSPGSAGGVIGCPGSRQFIEMPDANRDGVVFGKKCLSTGSEKCTACWDTEMVCPREEKAMTREEKIDVLIDNCRRFDRCLDGCDLRTVGDAGEFKCLVPVEQGYGTPRRCAIRPDRIYEATDEQLDEALAIIYPNIYGSTEVHSETAEAPKDARTVVQIHGELCDGLKELYAKKNADYGNSFGQARKEIPNYTLGRLYDKFNRIKNLMLGAEQQVKDEAVEDTLRDLANYCLMELAERIHDKEEKECKEM